jgi:N4-gp56 family major capsid protein
MGAITGKTLIPNINSYYDRTLLTRLLPNLVFTNFGQVRDIPMNNSDTIKFRRYNTLSAALTPLTEGVVPAGTTLSVTTLTATIADYGDYVTLTDKLEMETEDPVETEAVQVLGEQAANTLDQLAAGILAAGTTVQYAAGVVGRVNVAAGDNMNVSEVRKAVRTLKDNNAKKITSMVDPQTGFNTSPVQASYVGICHPRTSFDLKNDSAWVSIEKYGSAVSGNVLPGEIGKLDEVRFIETTNAPIFAGAGAAGIDVYGTIILGQDAYGVTRISGNALQTIRKQLGSAGSADPLNQLATIGWKATFVTEILQQLAMIRIEHAVSA